MSGEWEYDLFSGFLMAKKNHVDKVILFGSRARGDMDRPVKKELLDAIEREGVVIYEKV
mgnify:CR=1 FL=1